MQKKVKLKTEKLKREKMLKRVLLIALVLILFLLLILYIVVGIIYNRGNFSITLDKNLYFDRGLIIYDDPLYKVYRSELLAPAPETFDNISYRWLPTDIANQEGGSHNGDNYLAYTFYVENTGDDVTDYWSEVVIDDIIRNVDEAVRIRVYKNGEATTYAKLSTLGEPEPVTVPFENPDENLVALDHVASFGPGQVDKYTIVIWVEGSDLECTDNILGGEFQVHMNFNSEIDDE